MHQRASPHRTMQAESSYCGPRSNHVDQLRCTLPNLKPSLEADSEGFSKSDLFRALSGRSAPTMEMIVLCPLDHLDHC